MTTLRERLLQREAEDEARVRRWAAKHSEQLGDVFLQHLLGNRSFEDCAIEALEVLMSGRRVVPLRELKEAREVEDKAAQWDELMERLENGDEPLAAVAEVRAMYNPP